MTETDNCLVDAYDRAERFLDIKLRLALQGDAVVGPCNIAKIIIALLESGEDITRTTRILLAQAFVRGLNDQRIEEVNTEGHPLPWITVGGLGRDGKVNKAILERRRWLDAAEEVEKLRAAGRKGNGLLVTVGEAHGVGFDAMKNARAMLRQFQQEIGDANSEITAKCLNLLKDNAFDPTDETHYYLARTLFIERDAENAVRKVGEPGDPNLIEPGHST